MQSTKVVRAAVDFAKVTSSLGLSRETLSALSSFRSRNAQAKTSLASLKAQKADVDWAHYRGVLKNQEVVDKLEKIWKDFKPQDYDVAAQLKAIEQFESKAVSSAQDAAKSVQSELASLNETLKNIEGARPVDQLTIADVDKAEPRISQTVESMVKKGKFGVEGYNEKFGSLSLM